MTEALEIRTPHVDVSDVVRELAPSVDDLSIRLPCERPIEDGEWVRFTILLADGNTVFEGVGRSQGSRPEGPRFLVHLSLLQFDARNGIMFERMLLARDAEAERTGTIDLNQLGAELVRGAPSPPRSELPPARAKGAAKNDGAKPGPPKADVEKQSAGPSAPPAPPKADVQKRADGPSAPPRANVHRRASGPSAPPPPAAAQKRANGPSAPPPALAQKRADGPSAPPPAAAQKRAAAPSAPPRADVQKRATPSARPPRTASERASASPTPSARPPATPSARPPVPEQRASSPARPASPQPSTPPPRPSAIPGPSARPSVRPAGAATPAAAASDSGEQNPASATPGADARSHGASQPRRDAPDGEPRLDLPSASLVDGNVIDDGATREHAAPELREKNDAAPLDTVITRPDDDTVRLAIPPRVLARARALAAMLPRSVLGEGASEEAVLRTALRLGLAALSAIDDDD